MAHSDNALFWARVFSRLFPFPAALQASLLDTTDQYPSVLVLLTRI